MPSWEEQEEKMEITGAAAAKVEEMRGPGCSEHHRKGQTMGLAHPRVPWFLHPPPPAPTPPPALASPSNSKRTAHGSNNSSDV